MKDTFDKAVDMVERRDAEIERLRIFIGDAKEAIDADDVIAAYHILDAALTSTPASSCTTKINTQKETENG